MRCMRVAGSNSSLPDDWSLHAACTAIIHGSLESAPGYGLVSAVVWNWQVRCYQSPSFHVATLYTYMWSTNLQR